MHILHNLLARILCSRNALAMTWWHSSAAFGKCWTASWRAAGRCWWSHCSCSRRVWRTPDAHPSTDPFRMQLAPPREIENAMCPLARPVSLVRQFSLALPAHGRRKKAALVAPMLHTNIVYKKYSNIHNYLNEINWSYREGGVSRRWGCYMWCIVDGLKLYTARRLTRRMSNLNFFLLGIHSRPAVRLSFKCKLRGHHPSARDQSFSYQSINQAKPSSLCFISARSTVINGGRGRNWKRGRCWSSMGAQNLLELI